MKNSGWFYIFIDINNAPMNMHSMLTVINVLILYYEFTE